MNGASAKAVRPLKRALIRYVAAAAERDPDGTAALLVAEYMLAGGDLADDLRGLYSSGLIEMRADLLIPRHV